MAYSAEIHLIIDAFNLLVLGGTIMAKIRVGINGMGRIGRSVLRILTQTPHPNLEVVAVNNPGVKERYTHLVKYDSCHGIFPLDVKVEGDTLTVGDQNIHFFGDRDPSEINWSEKNVDIVIDSTGRFKDKEALGRHMKGTVKKVIMCAPGKDLDGTFVMGINSENYDPSSHHIVSNASCTTNCLAPVAKVLNDSFGIESGFMTTVHSYTLDQRILDGSHADKRRSRTAAVSMIPTTTGAAKAVGMVIPSLKGKLDGYAVRVPTPNVSLVDLTVRLNKSANATEINSALKAATESSLKGILDYTEEELVSVDFMGRTHSSIVDASLTNVIGDHVKVVAWYDNEVGFSNRVVDLTSFVGSQL